MPYDRYRYGCGSHGTCGAIAAVATEPLRIPAIVNTQIG
jgi:hypothetical protein